MVTDLNKRDLFNKLRGGKPQIRPPWSLEEDVFTERCSSCGDCVAACPTGLLTKGRAGYPIADFSRGSCTFCGACAAACRDHCYDVRSAQRPWNLQATVSTLCVEAKGVSCRMCGEACLASAIRFTPAGGGRTAVHVVDSACTGCGACLSDCPVSAITMAVLSEEATT